MRLFPIALLLLSLTACSGPGSGQQEISSISNGLVRILVNREKGLYTFIDMVSNDTLIESAGFQCSTDQNYIRGRERLKFFRVLEDSLGSTFSTGDAGRLNHVTKSDIETNLGEGSSITLSSRMEGENVLDATFTLYPGQSFIDISWGFHNLTGDPVQVHKADLLYGAVAFPSAGVQDDFFMLDGN